MIHEASPTRTLEPATASPVAARVILVGKAGWTEQVQAALQKADLAGPNAQVRGVDDFLCALGEASQNPPDVVIGQLEHLDGLGHSIAAGFRTIAPDVLLLLTAPMGKEDAAAVALVDGFDDYLIEPIDAHILARFLQTRLSPAARGLARATPDPDKTAAPTPPVSSPSPEPAPRRGHDRRPMWPGMPHPDDVELLDHLLAEHKPIVDHALPILERRSRLRGVQFIAADGTMLDDRVVAPVEYGDQTLGYLLAPLETGERALQAWAAWLARWIALERQQATLWKQAHIDDLTGVWNRRYFDRRLGELIENARQQRARVTLMVFDIDNFKSYNDRFGHDAGDEILRETARLMRSVVRTHDIVARIGGDEFAVIFWDAEQRRRPDSHHPDDVRRAAERFQEAINAAKFPKLGAGAPGKLTISGGLAGYPWDARSAPELLHAADAAAMQSKRQGKNALTFGPGA